MITLLRHLRTLSQFESHTAAASESLSRLTLVYADNGRGKTTLAAIFRSLAANDPSLLLERKRLGSAGSPHVVLDSDIAPSPLVFQNGAWNHSLPAITVFDDNFVASNVCSGLDLGADHRQNLHEFIIGAQGVTLSQDLANQARAVDVHNRELRAKGDAITPSTRGPYTVEAFCALKARPNIDQEIAEKERALAAAREAAPVQATPGFSALGVPQIDVVAIDSLLSRTLDDLNEQAADLVQQHLAELPAGGEQWVSAGLGFVEHGHEGSAHSKNCPFCAQDLGKSPVLAHYQAYFSESYANLKHSIERAISAIEREHGAAAQVSFVTELNAARSRREFWSRFCKVPEINLDPQGVTAAWSAARDEVLKALREKQARPLEKVGVSDSGRAALSAYVHQATLVEQLSAALLGTKDSVDLVKEQTRAAQPGTLEQDLLRLRATKARFEPATAALCDAYLAEVAAKSNTERARDAARIALDRYRANVFPNYQTAINHYLGQFNAGFRVGSLQSANVRSGSTCTYSVLINNVAVPAASDGQGGTPSFRSTLSAGDRNALALAFFFASLDQDANKAGRVVVIDDPVTSLDEHRTLTTAQEIRRMSQQVNQMVVLSHSKPFLCQVWNGSNPATTSALEITRIAQGSSITTWNVNEDAVTEYDKAHRMLREFNSAGVGDLRSVAEKVRPALEGFLRVACPEHFPPGTLLGPFRAAVLPLVGTDREVMSRELLTELQDLTEYGNRFHHDTNPNWMTATVNDGELQGFVRRTLQFTRR